MQQDHGVRRYDFTWFPEDWKTLKKEDIQMMVSCGNDKTIYHEKIDKMKIALNQLCLNWVFQIEEAPSTGRIHFQGRFHLHTKARAGTIMNSPWFVEFKGDGFTLSITSSNTQKKFDYVMKVESRVTGPFKDEKQTKEDKVQEVLDKFKSIPYEIDGIELKCWQKDLMDELSKYHSRQIDILFDPHGNIGKSIFIDWMEWWKDAFVCPTINNSKDLCQAVCSYCNDQVKRPSIFLFDFEKAGGSDRTQMHQLFRAVESIKNGRIYDTRYKWQSIRLPKRPRVLVMTNTIPDKGYLTEDRWVFWRVVNDQLERFDPAVIQMVQQPTKDQIEILGLRQALSEITRLWEEEKAKKTSWDDGRVSFKL